MKTYLNIIYAVFVYNFMFISKKLSTFVGKVWLLYNSGAVTFGFN